MHCRSIRAVLTALCLVVAGCAPAPTPPHRLILVGLDGWRWDYDRMYEAPTLARLASEGARTDLIPSFPSKTFPNFYTLVTGLTPGHHGIVANAIKDPTTGRRFAASVPEEVGSSLWWGGEPLWATVQKTGRRSAAMFWPGSEAEIGGERPGDWRVFDDKVPGAARVDQVLAWLDRPEAERPDLVTMYLGDVDVAGHHGGPESIDVARAVARVDGFLRRLVTGLESRGLFDSVNLVILSDHGMASITQPRPLVLDDYVALEDVEVVDMNPTVGLFPRKGREAHVFQALSTASPHLTVYRRGDSPPHWQFRDHPRVPPIVGVVDEGWEIVRRETLERRLRGAVFTPHGEHGYDPATAMSMRGILVARGPAFARGVRVPAISNVHVYAMLCAAMGLTPAANDGDPAIGRALLR